MFNRIIAPMLLVINYYIGDTNLIITAGFLFIGSILLNKDKK